ncbi:MAG: diol dehydratase small subunit [Alphaproteobacteria bacterium]
MTDDRDRRSYPLGKHHRRETSARSGRPLSNVSAERLLAGEVTADDVAISADTLLLQAGFAKEAGFEQVADNLARAAEMTRIPDRDLLDLYEALRPGRSTYYQLLSLSQQIASQYDAELTGAYIREAADVYRETGMLKMSETDQ